MSKLLRGLLTKPRLLCSNRRLLSAELANPLPCGHLSLLLLLKSRHRTRLSLCVALRKQVSDGRRALFLEISLKLCALNCFSLAAKCARPHGLCRESLLGDLPLTVNLANGFVNNLLTIRVHEGLCCAGLETLRGTANSPHALRQCRLPLRKTGLCCR